jgi:hypothetical protein
MLIAGLSMAFPAVAATNLPGEYEGKIKEVEDYSGKVGETCVVKIGSSDRYGGSTSFSVNDVDTMLFENKNVDAALASGDQQIKLHTPGRQLAGSETVNLKLRPDGTVQYLKLMRYTKALNTRKTIACGDLTRK